MVVTRLDDFLDPNYMVVQDEFTCCSISNTNTSNSIGVLGWGTSATGTSAPVVTAGVASHPGIITLTTGASSGDNNRLHLTDAAATAFSVPADIERFAWIVRVPTITTASVRIGIGQDISSTTFGTAGAWFSYDAAVSTFWQTITRQASTSTTNTSAVTVTAGNWFLLQAIRLASGNWEFYINGTLVFTHSANLPTTACNVGCMVQTATTAARTLGVDWFRMRTINLGQRYT
jgi:hypothetical protein